MVSKFWRSCFQEVKLFCIFLCHWILHNVVALSQAQLWTLYLHFLASFLFVEMGQSQGQILLQNISIRVQKIISSLASFLLVEMGQSQGQILLQNISVRVQKIISSLASLLLVEMGQSQGQILLQNYQSEFRKLNLLSLCYVVSKNQQHPAQVIWVGGSKLIGTQGCL